MVLCSFEESSWGTLLVQQQFLCSVSLVALRRLVKHGRLAEVLGQDEGTHFHTVLIIHILFDIETHITLYICILLFIIINYYSCHVYKSCCKGHFTIKGEKTSRFKGWVWPFCPWIFLFYYSYQVYLSENKDYTILPPFFFVSRWNGYEPNLWKFPVQCGYWPELDCSKTRILYQREPAG